ncbi:hypothetical protein [Sphingomonas sp. PAMC 26605]|uniref:hypothetical protein n=1 Tax=Sphingomonas sp. PAMC 26605 TaxID=1112214 RepID=UPI00026CD604|nr:hypothetical protein [Sphingomonas sp. PAMC 26605]
MQNRTPVAREARPALPEFTPVPRKYRHDGWTPERQKAFIEALADTGSVSRAAAMCNMAQANAYTLRRAPGAEEFRRAWDAALDYGVQRLKDIAFERAIEGELVPVIAGGKVIGYRRKRNDALLMFCLRHYGQDAEGRRTTINYVSTRATAGASAGAAAGAGASVGASAGAGAEAGAVAEATTTTMRTSVTGAPDLAAVAARDAGGEAAADAAEDDPDTLFLRVPEGGSEYRGTLQPAPDDLDDALAAGIDPFEPDWSEHGADQPAWVSELAERQAPSQAIIDAVAVDPGAVDPDDGVAAVKRPRRRRKPG